MKQNMRAWIFYGGLFTMLLLHLPFIHADPDIDLSASRDAFTDEGLNTSQLRNYINHGNLDFMECDNLVKTPLFNAVLLFPFKIFGTHLNVARLTILIIVLTILLLLSLTLHNSLFTLILLATTLLQYYVFQYCHFSLSEMLSVALILAGVIFLYRFIEKEFHNFSHLFISVLFISLGWYVKIQFVYITILIPISLILTWLLYRNKNPGRSYLKSIVYSIGSIILFTVIYYFAWYEPHQAEFNYVMSAEAGDKYASLASLPKTVAFNIIYVLFSKNSWAFNTLVIICFLAGCRIWIRSADRKFRVLFLISLIWVLLELHKMTMVYLPSRYLASYYFAAGFLSSIVLARLILENNTGKNSLSWIFSRRFGILLLSLFLINNVISYGLLLNHRQYQLHTINEYFTKTIGNSNELVMGPWAPSLTWESKVTSKPVWHNFMNDKNILEKHPRVILSEPDEEESNHAYSLQGMVLAAKSDSVRSFSIGSWIVNAYWIHSK